MSDAAVDEAGLEERLAIARSLADAGRAVEAERAYLRLLECAPTQVQALTYLATTALRRNDARQAIAWLSRARHSHPDDPQLLKNLGVAHEAAGDAIAAQEALLAALRIAPGHATARLHLAGLYERSGRDYEALVQYFRAVTTAQSAGYWVDRASTPRWLLAKVEHASMKVMEGRAALFNGCLDHLRQRHGTSVLARVQRWLDGYLRMQVAIPDDARQRPKFMYLPDIPSRPYYDRAYFDFIPALEAAVDVVREEMIGCLQKQPGIEPFLGEIDPQRIDEYLAAAGPNPGWDALFFYRHGERYGKSAEHCPRTAALLEDLPLVRIRGHAPEICFSWLAPGTHILPHYGVTNTRLVLHLPLVVPEGCMLVVGGQPHRWQEGRCVVFDDTYLHEAWNRSDELRAVLIMDVWNPCVTEPEQAAIAELVAVIGDFNRACEWADRTP